MIAPSVWCPATPQMDLVICWICELSPHLILIFWVSTPILSHNVGWLDWTGSYQQKSRISCQEEKGFNYTVWYSWICIKTRQIGRSNTLRPSHGGKSSWISPVSFVCQIHIIHPLTICFASPQNSEKWQTRFFFPSFPISKTGVVWWSPFFGHTNCLGDGQGPQNHGQRHSRVGDGHRDCQLLGLRSWAFQRGLFIGLHVGITMSNKPLHFAGFPSPSKAFGHQIWLSVHHWCWDTFGTPTFSEGKTSQFFWPSDSWNSSESPLLGIPGTKTCASTPTAVMWSASMRTWAMSFPVVEMPLVARPWGKHLIFGTKTILFPRCRRVFLVRFQPSFFGENLEWSKFL